MLLDGQGRPRLADCGLARPMLAGQGTMAAYSTRLGEVGTPGYIDPEYIKSGQYHRYSDVYAMGITILQAITGRAARWTENNLADFVYDNQENHALVADQAAEWPAEWLPPLIALGLNCTETGRGAARRRPTVPDCIAEVLRITELPPLPPPPVEQRECMVCLEAPRLTNRFLPCQHAACCNDCAQVMMAQGHCPICRRAIDSVQEGTFESTFIRA